MWGFSSVTLTVIFGIYAVAVLAALLVTGRLSDHLGRRPVLIAAVLGQALVMLMFATAASVTGLLIARGVQGITTGAAIGAVGAAMIDLDKYRGPIANAVGAPFGTALGCLIGGDFPAVPARSDALGVRGIGGGVRGAGVRAHVHEGIHFSTAGSDGISDAAL